MFIPECFWFARAFNFSTGIPVTAAEKPACSTMLPPPCFITGTEGTVRGGVMPVTCGSRFISSEFYYSWLEILMENSLGTIICFYKALWRNGGSFTSPQGPPGCGPAGLGAIFLNPREKKASVRNGFPIFWSKLPPCAFVNTALSELIFTIDVQLNYFVLLHADCSLTHTHW